MKDDKSSADAIIIFVNYLLKMIDQSKLRFNEDVFLTRIFDKYYVKSDEYSNLLVQDIPKRQRVNIAIQVILKREEGDIYSLGFFLKALLQKLESAELSRVCKVISDELKFATENEDIRCLLHICPGKYWDKIEPAVRMRIENILYDDFSKGTYDLEDGKCGEHGALATWITEEHLLKFGDLERWTQQAIDMIRIENTRAANYVNCYFWQKICSANRDEITQSLKDHFRYGLESNYGTVVSRLREIIEWDETHPWWNVFAKELEKYPDIKYDPNGLPF